MRERPESITLRRAMTQPWLTSELSAPHVVLDGVHVQFGDRMVFRDLSLGFPRGAISVLLGGSGSGKSTLLRLVAGLVRPTEGSVRIAGQDITRLSERELYPVRRRIGMLFQGGALLDSFDVFENVALPLREHSHLSEAEIATEVHKRLAAVGLSDVDSLLPSQLSGGMLRRVALARAIITDPEVLLCDEPFSGLDPLNVRRIERLLMTLNQRLGLTLIVASHHIASALRMGLQIVFFAPGGNAVVGSPAELRAGRDPRVTEFLNAELNEEIPTGVAS